MRKTSVVIIWLSAVLAAVTSLNLELINNTVEVDIGNNLFYDQNDASQNQNNTSRQNETATDQPEETDDESSAANEDQQSEQNLDTYTETTITNDPNLYTSTYYTSEVNDNDQTSSTTDNNEWIVTTVISPGSSETNEEYETVSVKDPDYNATREPEDDKSSERSAEHSSDNLVIQTTSGPVRGQQWNDNQNILSFIDIPYGVYSGLFQAPEPPKRWETVHEDTEHTKRCPQLQDDFPIGDTDCLTLSIFTPNNAEQASVLFHVHGGSLDAGSGDPAIYGPENLVSKGIILVLPNYRIGPLGFLCMQSNEIPGNAALKDLTLALNWTKTNIEAFGGNSLNIIVSGDGTSGSLAGYLALSPKSNRYINKVIIESGSVLSYLALDRDPLLAANKLLNNLKEHESLNQGNVTDILIAGKGIEFLPCVEKTIDPFMNQTPWEMISTKEIDITFLIGSAMFAGIHEAHNQTVERLSLINNDYGLLLPNDLKFKSNEERTLLGQKIKKQYFGENAIEVTDIENLAVYYTDSAYLGPGIRTARLLMEAGAAIYLYEFSFVGDFNRALNSMNTSVEGAVKGDLVGYLFTQDGQLPTENSKEETIINTLADLWFNFMYNGTPSTENVQWDRLNTTNAADEQWLSIGAEVEMRTGFHVERLTLWTDIYDNHFIDRNLASQLPPTDLTLLLTLTVLLVGFKQNDSHLY